MSYDFDLAMIIILIVLKGHQIIGELRLYYSIPSFFNWLLKGHQIIGELRLPWKASQLYAQKLKGHQIIGELRHDNLYN